jgi:outer membrane protein OmpA-like peptidoglycan-associated protein
LNPYSDLSEVKYWDNPNRTSADIHKNGKYQAILRLGQSFAYSGKYYLGLIWASNGFRDEYAETKLKRPLKKDSLYCIKMYVMADNRQSYYKASVYAAFSNKYYHQHERNYFFLPDTIGFRKWDGSIIENTDSYIEFSNIYKAKGKERYFFIGNFNLGQKMRYLDSPSNFHKTSLLGYASTYYYFDDISVVPIQDSSQCPCYRYKKPKYYSEIEDLRFGIRDKKYILSNVKFLSKLSKFKPSPNGDDELKTVLEALQKDTTIKMRIEAYAFDADDLALNKKISKDRSEVLKNWFINHKLSPERIETEGYGSSRPIFDNDTQEHRDKNTRIELIFRW